MDPRKILIVDDEVDALEVYQDTLEELEAVTLVTESDPRKALERLATESFDLLLTDISMPHVNGLQILQQARVQDCTLPVLMLTAFPSVESAVESLQLGAADYLIKPFTPEKLLAVTQRLLAARRNEEEVNLLYRQLQGHRFDEIVGQSASMLKVYDVIERIAGTDTDVLITGKTGTGKDLVAKSIHRRSDRAENRLVPVDCGAIPLDLLESEFFGHERGAFTGANQKSMGLIRFAHQGTFFLDEVGELPLTLQAKLLRVLQERKIRPVGSNEEIPVDIRLIAATSRDLQVEVEEGRFREDLFYRINVVKIQLPTLAKRGNDVLLLARHFIQKYAKEMGKTCEGFSQEVESILLGYTWPGNIRELQNLCRRAVALTRESLVSSADLPEEILEQADLCDPSRSAPGYYSQRKRHLEDFERDYFHDLLVACEGDVGQAVERSGVSRAGLYRFFKRFSLEPERFRG